VSIGVRITFAQPTPPRMSCGQQLPKAFPAGGDLARASQGLEIEQEGARTMSQSNNAERNGGPDPPGGRKAEPLRRLRGFAAMDPEKRRQVSSIGGRAAHQKGTGHQFTSDEAREAGRKGGRATAAARAGRQEPSESEPPAVIPFPDSKDRA
jgi:general stress protein YciG